jgi:hypothetical protein
MQTTSGHCWREFPENEVPPGRRVAEADSLAPDAPHLS